MSNSEISTTIVPNTLRNILVGEEEVALIVRGNSMLPYLKEGDRVSLRNVGWEKLRVGDLLAFEQNQVIFTHRLIIKTSKTLLTKGDNNFYPDPPLNAKKILGKVIAFERDGRFYSIEGKRILINIVLGYCHAVIGIVSRPLLGLLNRTPGKFRRPWFWVGRGVLLPVKLFERILLYVE